ncbi:MAG: cellulase family glycosylhydrolase, partial [Chitinispirillia bacterium]
QVKTYSKAVINAIRQHDPDNIIIVGCPFWDQDIHKVADSPLTGFTNIMYSVHFYAATHGKWLRDRCDYALGKNIPIIVSECNGAEASGSGRIAFDEWKAWIDYMDKKKISWLNWSVSDKPGEACSILKPGTSANGGWKESDLTQTGVYIRKTLRGYKTTQTKTPKLQSTHSYINTGFNNGKIKIKYTLSDPENVILKLFNMNGTLLLTKYSGKKSAGMYNESITMENLSNAVYIIKMKTGSVSHHDRVVLMR